MFFILFLIVHNECLSMGGAVHRWSFIDTLNKEDCNIGDVHGNGQKKNICLHCILTFGITSVRTVSYPVFQTFSL